MAQKRRSLGAYFIGVHKPRSARFTSSPITLYTVTREVKHVALSIAIGSYNLCPRIAFAKAYL